VTSRTNSSRGWVGAKVTKFNASSGASVWVAPERKVDDPAAVAVAGDDVFVADGYEDSVTELSASTGAPVRVLSGAACKFKAPNAMAVADNNLFVTRISDEKTSSGPPSSAPDSISELDVSTGALVRVILGAAYKFDLPVAMVVAGDDLFVANEEGNSVTELNASTGALVRVFSSAAYKFDLPVAMAVAGDDLFVANYKGNSVTELSI